MVIDCISIANKILATVIEDLKEIKKENVIPHLVIVKVNNDPASEKYVNNKVKKANELGIKVTVVGNNFNYQNQLITKIKQLNDDKTVNGYIVQLPLPIGFNKEEVFELINVKKDADGLSNLAISRNFSNSSLYAPIPCTANGIIEIIKNCNYSMTGKHAVIINRSAIVGKPLIGLFLKENATVTVCHSKTENLSKITNSADIIVCGVGKPSFLNKNMVNKDAFVVDVGINVVNNKIVGDTCFDELKDYVKYITPVPNGVGKLTVAMLFKNLIDLTKWQIYGKIS